MREPEDMPPTDARTLLRQSLREKRSDLSAKSRQQWDQSIGHHVSKLVASLNSKSIACFFPFNGEPDITGVYRQLMASGCKLALPVISANGDRSMAFHAWRKETRLVRNRFGIFEPGDNEPVPPTGFDILLTPLVGYDSHGNRLGVGGGYYDRYLEAYRDSAKPLRVGIAYSQQEINPIDANIWDIPLHGIVNERGWFTFV